MTDLLETREDGIAWLTLNRPDRLNAFSPAMLQALSEALQRLGSDAEVGTIVITGAGRGFCAGGDVKTMENRAVQGFEERVEGLRRMHQLPLLLRTLPTARGPHDQRPGSRPRPGSSPAVHPPHPLP